MAAAGGASSSRGESGKGSEIGENIKTAVQLEGVSKRFGYFFALKSVSLSVKVGEFVALLGPNGAGKTTLIKIIATQMKPTAGTVKIFGENAFQNSSKTAELRHEIGLVAHESFLYDELTVRENLAFYAKLFALNKARERFCGGCESSWEETLSELVEFLNLGRWLDVKAKHLSYGLRKRADIARALIHRPSLVLLDEPFGGLDESSKELLAEYFKCFKGKTLILSSHSYEWAKRVCERGILLERGEVKQEICL
ncbi:MAG: ABC transporter ATP-binding protein [Candidatus Methanospirare jalkutatii]|nr:MAG: ABC transporter ATP-binding protein [Candidatus Methanospirare jalkutatii]